MRGGLSAVAPVPCRLHDGVGITMDQPPSAPASVESMTPIAPTLPAPQPPGKQRPPKPPPPRRRRLWIWIVLLVLLAAGGYYFWSKRKTPAPTSASGKAGGQRGAG